MIYVYHLVLQAKPKSQPARPKSMLLLPFYLMYMRISAVESLVYLTILLNTIVLCLVWPY